MHEEDHGLLWKHVDYRSGHSESRRSRRLVISTISTVVNYEYAFYFYLYQDGTVALVRCGAATCAAPRRVTARVVDSAAHVGQECVTALI